MLALLYKSSFSVFTGVSFFCLVVQKCFFLSVSGAGWFVSVFVAVVLRLLFEFYISSLAMKFMLYLRTYICMTRLHKAGSLKL